MDRDWKFHFGDAGDPSRDFQYGIAPIFVKSGKTEGTAIAPNFPDSSWRRLDLPHDWAVELPFVNSPSFDVMSHGYKPVGGAYPATSIGWYRKHFMIAAADSGKRTRIRFDGIFRDSRIWLNGFYLGNNLSGYSSCSFDVTDYLQYGKENVLVVRVDATQYEGWFYEGAGIYRHVWLDQYEPLHIIEDGLFVHTTVTGRTARVAVESTVINEAMSATGTSTIITSYLENREGKILGHTTATPLRLAPGETQTLKQEIVLTGDLKLWSPDNPYLYRVRTVISRIGGRTTIGKISKGIERVIDKTTYKTIDPKIGNVIDGIIDERKIRIGIRTIRIDATGLYVNGIYTKVKGVNAHQDHAGVGSALPDYLQYYRIQLLKQLGANAYRSSHNPPATELLDACDSLGMLVMDENRLLNSSPEYLGQWERLIRRDRSRASVFLWSIGNEEGHVQTSPTGKRIAQTLLACQRQLDPTRLSTYAADLGNIFTGVNEVIPVRGFNYRVFGVDPYHQDHPDQPIVGTEMGSTVTTRGIYTKDSIAGYLPDEDITAPWWANLAEQWWPEAAERSWWMGGFVWTGFDYRGEPTPFQWPNINSHFGVMDICGFPKNLYYYYQSWWSDQDVLHISPHWNWKGREGQEIPVWVNSNADRVELFLNGKSLGEKEMPRNRHLEWKVAYAPGNLTAIGWRKGKKLEATVETTGDPYEVVVTPYTTTMTADGRDASVINISVTDRQGREVPDANPLIRFTVKGDLHILGVGNGDPSSHEADKCPDSAWQRHLFNGKCQVIVQAGMESSLARFEARADGLQTGSTDIYTVRPGIVTPVLRTNPSGTKGVSLTRANPARGQTVSLIHGRRTSSGPASGVRVRPIGKMLGADISFLPELEDKGIQFSDKGVKKDAIAILKDHGINYIRLRIFNDPAGDSGYSPGKGFCDLAHTLQMARRVKAAGLQFLLDFHYSDYWADPGKQFKPAAWKGQDFIQLQQCVYAYTKQVMEALRDQKTLPDMVQVGNEINHGMIWPEGRISHPDSLAALIDAGTRGVKAVDPGCPIMLHIALGGQNAESHFFLDNMLQRGLSFDVIGLSYYPKWHGTLADLKYNVNDLARHYRKDVIVVEYTQLKKEVNEIAFDAEDGRGKGTCIWEPLNTWEQIFDKEGRSNELLMVYDELSRRFMRKQ